MNNKVVKNLNWLVAVVGVIRFPSLRSSVSGQMYGAEALCRVCESLALFNTLSQELRQRLKDADDPVGTTCVVTELGPKVPGKTMCTPCVLLRKSCAWVLSHTRLK